MNLLVGDRGLNDVQNLLVAIGLNEGDDRAAQEFDRREGSGKITAGVGSSGVFVEVRPQTRPDFLEPEDAFHIPTTILQFVAIRPTGQRTDDATMVFQPVPPIVGDLVFHQGDMKFGAASWLILQDLRPGLDINLLTLSMRL